MQGPCFRRVDSCGASTLVLVICVLAAYGWRRQATLRGQARFVDELIVPSAIEHSQELREEISSLSDQVAKQRDRLAELKIARDQDPGAMSPKSAHKAQLTTRTRRRFLPLQSRSWRCGGARRRRRDDGRDDRPSNRLHPVHRRCNCPVRINSRHTNVRVRHRLLRPPLLGRD